jgi:high affinity Mn2+ porin
MAVNRRRQTADGRWQGARGKAHCALLALLAIGSAGAARAQGADSARAVSDSESGSARWHPALLGTQMNFIHQNLLPFHALYSGANSLQNTADAKTSEAFGVYTGLSVLSGLETYLDVEMIRGSGIGRTVGLAAITNGDVIRQGSADLGDGPYIARAFVRYTIGGTTARDTLARAMDQLPQVARDGRLEITAGKFALTDLFDVNRYANSTRLQFMNWGLFNNTAWDYAADTRGYSNGVAFNWVHESWTFRAAAMQMPTKANGNKFDSALEDAHGLNAEFELHVPAVQTVVRLLAFENEARMGLYSEAIAIGLENNTVPNIAADDQPGRRKYGWGVNLEQPIADGGETGAFLRYGWSDGAAESFVFTESDRHASIGVQVSGAHWGRTDDRFGIATVIDGIVSAHQQYLADGGLGFLLGDGALNYGEEQVVEAYYRIQCGKYIEVSPDYQFIRNPGYNRDRGPVTVLSLRLNVRY